MTRNGRKPELLNNQLGTLYESENQEPSRLSKYLLAKRFQQLTSGAGVQNNRKLLPALIPPESPIADPATTAAKQLLELKLAGTYRGLKEKSWHYHKAKQASPNQVLVSGADLLHFWIPSGWNNMVMNFAYFFMTTCFYNANI